MRIAILQLARFGDILQTLPTIQALKNKYGPECKITLVVRSTFADAAKISPHVDKIVEFPSRDILGPVAQKDSAENRAVSLAKLSHWVALNILTLGEFDLLLNLTFSEASSFLAEVVPAKTKRGMRRAPDGAYWIPDSWSQYMYSQVLRKNLNLLHLNDLFLRIAEAETFNPWPVQVKSQYLQPVAGVSEGKRRIGIQTGASQIEKTLAPEGWRRICRSILSAVPNAELVFFGGKADIPGITEITKDEVISASNPRVLAGALAFADNFSWVKSCDYIVTPDTAIVHLASIAGTKLVYIPLGGVRAEDTGPYGENQCILYPAYATMDQLAEQVAKVIRDGKASSPTAESRTRFAKCANGSQRNEVFEKNFDNDEVRGLFAKSYYLLAEFRFGGRTEDIGIPKLGGAGRPEALDYLLQCYELISKVRRGAEFGQHYCVSMIEKMENKAELKALMTKIAEVDALLLEIQKSTPLVKPLIDLWSVAKENVVTQDLPELLGLTEGVYRELVQNAEIVQNLIHLAVEKAVAKSAEKSAEKTAVQKGRRKPLKELEQ